MRRLRFPPLLCYFFNMTADVIALFEQASELPQSDRAELAGLLLESLESEPDDAVEDAWAAELERRIAELDSGAVKPVPWATVRTKLLRRLREP
jgi:putative addiction module component (TIGR02574 family)